MLSNLPNKTTSSEVADQFLSAEAVDIAILIPCYNEEITVGKVINDFRQQLPSAKIYVFNNASTDRTAQVARQHGAILYNVKRQGKGHVVREMYRLIDADIYIMVDGDDTYPADIVHNLIDPILRERADMVVGSRLLNRVDSDFKRLNMFGNIFFLKVLNTIFNVKLTDILSGYRAMTRELVQDTPILSTGFEIETEITIRALEAGYIVEETPVKLGTRPHGSESKIHVIRDGLRILGNIIMLFRDYKPLAFFGFIGIIALTIGFILGLTVFSEFLQTGLVPRFPTAILAASLVLLGMLLISSGFILDAINRRFREIQYQIDRRSSKKL